MTQTICARCKGWVVAGSDAYGPYIHCVSCGRLTDLLAPPPETLALLTKRRDAWGVSEKVRQSSPGAGGGGVRDESPSMW